MKAFIISSLSFVGILIAYKYLVLILITNKYIICFKFSLVVKNTKSASYEFKYGLKYFLEYFFFIIFGLTSLYLLFESILVENGLSILIFDKSLISSSLNNSFVKL